MEDKEDYDAKRFRTLLDSFCLQQHVSGPTHKDGHTIDLVITKSCDDIVCNLHVGPPEMISDHSVIHFNLTISKPCPIRKEICYRKIHSIDSLKFSADIKESPLITTPVTTLPALVEQYNTVLKELLDTHAPLKKRVITLRPAAPWYNDSIREEKQVRRQLERKWRTTKLEVHKQNYLEQCKKVNDSLYTAKKSYYNALAEKNKGDQRAMFKQGEKLLHRKPSEAKLPTSESLDDLTNNFADFFMDKIVKIREDLQKSQPQDKSQYFSEETTCQSSLSHFTPTTDDEVLRIIQGSPNKWCDLDPLPTPLLKDCLEPLLPVIRKIVDLSLSTSTMSDNLKESILNPLIKKSILDCEILKNYRPLSNLPFIEKIIEKVVVKRLVTYLVENGLCDPLQSAYKEGHSTETALVKVLNDVLVAIDEKDSVVLVLIDLSAAFDTIDHKLLLWTLEHRLGIKGQVLAWIKSYLTNRRQRVVINGVCSEEHVLSCGVPQGSVLGPILFSMYLIPVRDILQKHGIPYHFYADDGQIYLRIKPPTPNHPETVANAKLRLENCVNEIRTWLAVHMLKCNDEKTECVVLESRFRESLGFSGFQFGDAFIRPSKSARDIGVIVDSGMTLESHVNSIVKQAWFNLSGIGSIREYLSKEAAETYIHAFVTTKLDYCNSLLHGLPQYLINKLQLIQNAAARIVTCTFKYEHITPVLMQLHWLPVHYRIQFKVLLLTYKSLHSLAPVYLKDLLITYKPSYSLRSVNSDNLLLEEPRSRTVNYGDRAFSISAPRLWNKLPRDIRHSPSVTTFKPRLKAHLFKEAYGLV